MDFHAADSNKRKTRATNDQCSESVSTYYYPLPRESKVQCTSDPIFGLQLRRNTIGLSSRQYLDYIESSNTWYESTKDHINGQDDFAGACQTGSGYFRESGDYRLNNFSPLIISLSSHNRAPSPLYKMPAGGTLAMSNQQAHDHEPIRQTAVHVPLNFLNSINGAENKVGSVSVNLRNFGHNNLIRVDNSPLETYSSGPSNQAILRTGKYMGFDAKEYIQKAHNLCISSDTEHNVPQFDHISTAERAPLRASKCTEPCGKDILLQVGDARSDVGKSNISQYSDKSRGDENINETKITETIDIQNMNQCLTGASPIHGYGPAPAVLESGEKDDHGHSSRKPDEANAVLPVKVARTSTENLWDGSIQLSSSVTVAALAIFKSGEKMPDANWPQFLEVKGKVRLVAFEKYIQGLPRSRTRGLMVISIRWKEGSPETGLAGIKQVAKGYKKIEKVGFAKISPSFDLYICPRCDTIFTILAKYGFLKGMGAVEDDQDSLIGCVIWRKTKDSSSSIDKNIDEKNQPILEQPFHSPSDSISQNVGEKSSSHDKQAPKSLEPEQPVIFSPTDAKCQPISEPPFYSPSKCFSQKPREKSFSHNQHASKSLNHCFELNKVMARFDVEKPAIFRPIYVKSQPMSKLPFYSPSDFVSVTVGVKCFAHEQQTPKPLNHSFELPRVSSFQLEKPVISLPFDAKGQYLPSMYDDDNNDDLPEFDYNAASFDAKEIPRKHEVLGHISATPPSAPKNIFDDDDMPEWRPDGSILPSPSPSAANPSYSFQEFPKKITQPRANVTQRDSTFAGGFNSNPALMAPRNKQFDANFRFKSTSRRGWRPH